MRLKNLLNDIVNIPADADRDVTGLALDSRKLKSGDVFFALKGVQQDGRRYIPDAIQKNVAAILVDADVSFSEIRYEQGIPIIPVDALQQQMGYIAARYFDYPAKKLQMIGVTGTNGKTSCTHFIAQILSDMGVPCGIIGTLGNGFYGSLQETGLTTPDAVTLQAALHQFVERGAKAVAMEVSSHSIDQGRVNGIDFEIGIFTNLTQDHLDYHGDMETYAGVKKRFLAQLPVKHIVLNIDDDYGRRWFEELRSHKSVYAYSLQHQLIDQLVYAKNITLSLQGIHADIQSPWGSGTLTLPLIGQFNLSNALAVLTALSIEHLPFAKVLDALSTLHAVPGRMQTLGGYNQPLVVVDYAHTPDALEKVLQALRAHTSGNLICVFGCGGDRDHGKRPVMAKIAEALADQIIVTSDNPRHEQPESIAEQIKQGFTKLDRVVFELDRSKAIEKSIQSATSRDCILIAGKGAERYQQIGDEKIPFDDVQLVKAHLEGC